MKTKVPENAIQINGGYFDYLNVRNNKFDIESYVKALDKIARFNGHSDYFWSVLNHLLLVSFLAMCECEDYEMCLHLLLHDLHEAMYVDIPRPLKRFLKTQYNFDWNVLTEEFDLWMYENVGLKPPTEEQHQIIKYYDNWALILEKREFFDEDMDWGWGEEYPDIPFRIQLKNLIEKDSINDFLELYVFLLAKINPKLLGYDK